MIFPFQSKIIILFPNIGVVYIIILVSQFAVEFSTINKHLSIYCSVIFLAKSMIMLKFGFFHQKPFYCL